MAVGELGSETLDCIVRDIQMAEDFAATVMLQDYAPGILTAELDGVPNPPYNSGITLPGLTVAFVPTPIIDLIVSDETVLSRGVDGSLESNIVVYLNFQSKRHEVVSKVEVQWKRSASSTAYEQLYAPVSGNSSTVTIPRVQDKRTYDLRIRAVVEESGVFSGWVVVDDYYVVGKSTPPPAPDSIELQRDIVAWTYDDLEDGIPLDHKGFLVRSRIGSEAIWEDANNLTRVATTRLFAPFIPDGTQRTVMVKAVDTAGNESLNFASLVVDPDDIHVENQLLWRREQPVFTGTKLNCSVISNQLVADDSGGLMWHVPIDPLEMDVRSPRMWLADTAALFWDGSSKEMEYIFQIIPPIQAYSYNALMRVYLQASVQGAKLEWQALGGARYYTTDATLFWTTDPTSFWGPSNLNWYPWAGGLRRPHREMYRFRITMIGGSQQGVITTLETYFDYPDKTRGGNYYLPVGGIRARSLAVTPAGIPYFNTIESVTVSIRDTDLPLTRVRVVDRALIGPLLIGYDDAGQLADGYIEVSITGF